MSKIEVDAIVPQSGTTLTVGESGDTITIPSGATFDASNATTTLPSTVVTTTGSQTLTNKTIDASQLTGTITPSDATVTTAKLADSSVTTAKLNDASVSLAKLTATGTPSSSTFLRGDNSWQEAGGGKVLQVVSTNITAITASTTTQSFLDISGFSVAITPSSASNKVLVLATFNVGSTSTSGNNYIRLVRDSTAINIGDANGSNARASWYQRGVNTNTMYAGSINFLDSPATTSSTTYKLQWYRNDGTFYLNRPGAFAGASESEGATATSTITVMEIAV